MTALENLNERWRKIGHPYVVELDEGGFELSCEQCPKPVPLGGTLAFLGAMNEAIVHKYHHQDDHDR